MTHTKGPWRAIIPGMSYPAIVRDKAHFEIAYIPETRDAEANANLIAAAPELLEMLKEFRVHFLAPGGPRYVAATRLINKAEGRPNE